MSEKNEVEEVEVENEEEVVEETTDEVVEETTEVDPRDATIGRLNRELTKAKKALDKGAPKQTNKSDDLDYGQKAFLSTQGIKGSKEFDFVQEQIKKSGSNIENLLENDYFKSELENFRSINKTADAIPEGNLSGSPAVDSVEYWSSKPIEEVPADMRIAVVNSKLEQETKKGVFYNSKK